MPKNIFDILTAVVVATLIAILLRFEIGQATKINVTTLSALSRFLASIFSCFVTCIAFILTITANLYSPRLIKVYIRNPILVAGFVLILSAGMLVFYAGILTPEHPHYTFANELTLRLGTIVCFATVPMLYHIIHFLRPEYFLPLLEKVSESAIHRLERGQLSRRNYIQVVEHWDVISNIALTAAKRDDRQLIRLSLRMLDESIEQLLTTNQKTSHLWRRHHPMFIPGLAKEACNLLHQEEVWPEAYILFKKLHVLKAIAPNQNEVIADALSNHHKSLSLAAEQGLNRVVDIHLMFIGTLMRLSIEAKDLERFQCLSYYYRQCLESLHDNMRELYDCFTSWVFYGKKAHDHHLDFSLETIYYDSGTLLINMGKKQDTMGIFYFNYLVKDLWQEGFRQTGRINTVAWRACVKTFWYAKLEGLSDLANEIERSFLVNKENVHYNFFLELTSKTSSTNWELSDRFLSFAYIPQAAHDIAKIYFQKIA